MRISDWSSDVCSSDLREGRRRRALRPEQRGRAAALGVGRQQAPRPADRDEAGEAADVAAPDPLDRAERSEEHTSELPSLMRISYAVFCLKKKKTIDTNEYVSIRQRVRREHIRCKNIQSI